MTEDPTLSALRRFLEAPPLERFEMALDPAAALALESYLGHDAFAHYVDLARHTLTQHLGVDSPENLVFVPGVMGSLLASEKLAGIWWVDVRTRNHIEDLRLAPDGLGDADARSHISPVSVDTSYQPFLTSVLSTTDFNPRLFAYDWRKSLLHSADRLRATVQDVYATNGGQPVHLVGHSMGGLMIRAALMLHGDELWPIVGKVCFIGTPHYGSPAIAGYLKHHFWGWEMLIVLRLYLSRKAFRSLWGVMELLPAPIGVYPGTHGSVPPLRHPCANFDLYDAAAWKLDLEHGEEERLQHVLDGAAAFHRQMYAHHMMLDPELRARMAVIAGVGKKTLFRLEYRHGLGHIWKAMNKITERDAGVPDREGDGRVPLASARLEYVAIRYVNGSHGDLPNISLVADDVFRWLRGHEMQLPDTPEGALAEHLGTSLEDGEDPGFLTPQEDEPGIAELEALDAEIEAGEHPEFIQARLL